jgi:predicted phage terminase large subunit-like protein
VLLGPAEDGTHFVLDVRRLRGTPQQVQALVRQTARQDGQDVRVVMEQEPGSAGVAVVDHYLRLLAGFRFSGIRSTGSKADRAQPLAAQAEGGAVRLLRGLWNKDFLDEIEMFPFGPHDDMVDAASLAFLQPPPVKYESARWIDTPHLQTPGERLPRFFGSAGRLGKQHRRRGWTGP